MPNAGDLIEVDYTPGASPVQDPAHNPADPLSAQFVATSDWTLLLCDKASDEPLLDLTPLATMTLSARLNRPLAMQLSMPADNPDLWAEAIDGDPVLAVGVRTVKAYRKGVLRAHTAVWNLDIVGDTDKTTVTVATFDPLIYLLKRPVRDITGDFTNPQFASPVAGATIIRDSLLNSIGYEGPLPITLEGGTFDTFVPPAADLSAYLSDWPVMLGDLITTLVDTGAVDVVLEPVETADGYALGALAQLNVVNQAGADLAGSVSFDYGTGGHTAAGFHRSFDMDTVANKVYFYLGPKIDDQHWKGNITATESGLETYLALEENSRGKYGTLMSISVYDDSETESAARPMFHQLWKQEVRARVKPRELVYVTPQAGVGPEPFDDYTIGDIVAISAGPDLVGPAMTGDQRVYGFDITVGEDGVERVGELIVSADGG